jgi:outer membrane protein OmpA-like peptidoglycan-associated protein
MIAGPMPAPRPSLLTTPPGRERAPEPSHDDRAQLDGPLEEAQLLLALQRGAGNAAVSRLVAGAGPRALLRQPTGTVADPAAKELQDFMSFSYIMKDVKPSTGGGLFDASYEPTTGQMVVTVRMAFVFKDGNILDPTWLAAIGGFGGLLGKGWKAEHFIWTEEEKRAWAAQAISDVQGVWSERYMFYSTKPGWESLPPVNVRVVIQEAPPEGQNKAQWVVTVNKWPDDASMQESMSWPKDRSKNQSTGTLHESSADTGGVDTPDVSDFTRTTGTRKRYGQVDTDNPVVIIFQAGKADVSATDAAALKKFGDTLGAGDIPPFPVTLTGHASTTEKPGEEQALSEERALAVSNAILAGGPPHRQPTATGVGSAGATDEMMWQRTDISVGDFQSEQRTVAHEFGHIIGLDDEYPTGDPVQPADPTKPPVPTARPVGAAPDHAKLVQDLMPGQKPVMAHHSDNIMSNGELVRPHHYVTFLEALTLMTGQKSWDVKPGPGQGGRGPGDFPLPTPSPDGTAVA